MSSKPNTVESSAWGDIFATTIRKGEVVLDAAAKAGHKVPRIYGYNTTPDHNNKKCIDFMLTDGKAAPDTAMRDWLVDYLKGNAKVLGVVGIISNRRVMGFPSQGSAYRGPEGGWRSYTGPNPHTDHVHVEFNTTAYKGSDTITPPKTKPSGDDKPAPKPSKPKGYPAPAADCAVYLDKLKPGTRDSDSVWRWQQAMNAISLRGGTELKLTGTYDAALEHETKLFQAQICGDPQDGWPGPKQATLAFQKAKSEMKRNGVRTLSIYKSSATGGLVTKVW